jgi:hypothetical protein
MDRKVTFQPVEIAERSGLTIATDCGVDRTSGRPCAAMVLASQDSPWTLFYETLETPARRVVPVASPSSRRSVKLKKA